MTALPPARTGRNQRRRQPSLGAPDRQHRDFPATGQAIRGPGPTPVTGQRMTGDRPAHGPAARPGRNTRRRQCGRKGRPALMTDSDSRRIPVRASSSAASDGPAGAWGDTLRDLHQRGYCTDEWTRWQQGQCGTYAVALMRLRPGLRFGTLGITKAGAGDPSSGWTPEHHFAHDDTYAYDSACRHPLPYHGVHGDADYYELDGEPGDWDQLGEEGSREPDIAAAQEHARRNRILDGPQAATRQTREKPRLAVNPGLGFPPAPTANRSASPAQPGASGTRTPPAARTAAHASHPARGR